MFIENVKNKSFVFSLIGTLLMSIYLIIGAISTSKVLTSLNFTVIAVFRHLIFTFILYILFTAMLILIACAAKIPHNKKLYLQFFKYLYTLIFILGLFIVIPNIYNSVRTSFLLGFEKDYYIIFAEHFTTLFFVLTIGTNISYKFKSYFKPLFFITLLSSVIQFCMIIIIYKFTFYSSLFILLPLAWLCYYFTFQK